MDLLDRMNRLESLLVAANGHIDSKDKIHKLAYLCQIAGDDLGQDFVFFLVGVNSPSLDFEIERAVSRGLIQRKQPIGYVINKISDDDSSIIERTGPGFNLVRCLANEPLQILELLSAIIYLNQVGYSISRSREKLWELKGQIPHEYEQSAWHLAEEHFNINAQNAIVDSRFIGS